nr:GPGG-motif small membrane protein [Rhabdothermincola salaria]
MRRPSAGKEKALVVDQEAGLVAFILWLIAVILVIAGIVSLVRRQWLVGAALIIIGFLVGPGGVSIFT